MVQTLASKSFRIVLGQTLQLNGDTITAIKGDAFTLTIQYDKGELILLSAAESMSLKTRYFAVDYFMEGIECWGVYK